MGLRFESDVVGERWRGNFLTVIDFLEAEGWGGGGQRARAWAEKGL